MYELIALAIAAITTASIKASQNAKERRRQELWTVERYRQQALNTQQAQLNVVKGGFVPGGALIETAQLNILADRLHEKRLKQDKAEFEKLMLFIGITAAALLVAVLVIKNTGK